MKGSIINALLLLCLTTPLLYGCVGKIAPSPNVYFQPEIAGGSSDAVSKNNQLSELVALSVQKMLSSQRGITANTTIAVADFVSLAANYDRPSMLGRYLGQAYLTALHNAGASTVDYQITGDIRVTPEGNLGLSQDYLELSNEVDANSVLVGTITSASSGYNVHIRVVDNASKRVIAADQFFLSKQEVNESVRVSL